MLSIPNISGNNNTLAFTGGVVKRTRPGVGVVLEEKITDSGSVEKLNKWATHLDVCSSSSAYINRGKDTDTGIINLKDPRSKIQLKIIKTRSQDGDTWTIQKLNTRINSGKALDSTLFIETPEEKEAFEILKNKTVKHFRAVI